MILVPHREHGAVIGVGVGEAGGNMKHFGRQYLQTLGIIALLYSEYCLRPLFS